MTLDEKINNLVEVKKQIKDINEQIKKYTLESNKDLTMENKIKIFDKID